MTMRSRLATIVSELRRRHVVKAVLIYAITAWIVVQVAATVAPLLNLPSWSATLVLFIAILGFPLMLVMAWVYDVTPSGVVATPAATDTITVPEPTAEPRSIAVLPFVDMSPAGDQQHFGDGIAEEILNVLARLPHLRVAARTSAFAFKGKSEDVRRIGEQLGVATVLEGSVRAAGNRIRITTQLIDVSNGYHLWSERYDRELGDVFAIQDEIAQSIVRALDLKISGEQRPRAQAITADMEAYDYYLRGRSYLAQTTKRSLEQAREMFSAAVARDAGFAAAYASAAEAASQLFLYWDPDPSNLVAAREFAERAIALAPDLPQVHVAHGEVLSLMKRYDDAARKFDAALQLDPVSFDALYHYGRSRWAAGDLLGAVKYLERAAEVRPEDYNAVSLLPPLYRALGRGDAEQAALVESLARVQRSLELNPDDARALYKGAYVLVMFGQRERGLEWAERAIAMDPGDAGTWYNVACLYARMGERDAALEKLEKAVKLGFAHREWILNDGDFLALRSDRRFVALLDNMTTA
jgi:adenylate cyclase